MSRSSRLVDSVSALAWATFATVLLAALALGTVHWPTLAVIAVLTNALGILGLRHARRLELPFPLPATIMLALAAYTALQAVPLPAPVLAFLAPSSADVWANSLRGFNEPGPAWASLSLDPGASLREVVKWVTYANVFIAASVVGARKGSRWGALLLFFAALIVAGVTGLHGLAGAERAYGLYTPSFGIPRWHLGPLLNSNNLAGYLNLGAIAALGALVLRQPPIPRWTLMLGCVAIIGVSIVAASRAGALALFFGILTFAGMLFYGRRGDRKTAPPKTVVLAVGGVLLGGTALALLGLDEEGWRELTAKGVDKLTLAQSTLPLLSDFALFGIGRGTFESVFPAYRMGADNVVFTHVENFVAQWLVEWGVIVGGGGLLAFAIALRPAALGLRNSSCAKGLVAGAAALLVHNLADLGLEVPGVVLALSASLGSAWGANAARRRESGAPPWTTRLQGRLWLGLPAFGGVSIAATLLLGSHAVTDSKRAVASQLESGDFSSAAVRSQFRGELRGMLQRHPAEPYLSYAGAVIAFKAQDQSPIPWLQRALERAPGSGRSHYLLARTLARAGYTNQALLEIRAATQHDRYLHRLGARLAVRIADDYSTLARAVPDGARGASVLVAMATALRTTNARVAQRCYEEAIARAPEQASSRLAYADHLIKGIERDQEPCRATRRTQCEKTALSQINRVESLGHVSGPAHLLRARLLAAQGKPGDAEKLLAAACTDLRDARECLVLRLDIAIRSKDSERVLRAAAAAHAQSCTSGPQCAGIDSRLGEALGRAGYSLAALTYLERAASEEPSVDRWLAVARQARIASLLGRADGAIARAQALANGPQDMRRIAAETLSLRKSRRAYERGN